MKQSFIDTLIALDKELTLVLNYDGGAFSDGLWSVLSSRLLWIPVAIGFLAYLFRKYRWEGKWIVAVIVVATALTITICDQTTSTLMKPMFARLRPSHTPGIIHLLHFVGDYRGGQYGFCSSHAANAFGAITLASLFIRRWGVALALVLLAALVSFSRIYMGVHFLGDVLCGALIGVATGYAMFLLSRRAIAAIEKAKKPKHNNSTKIVDISCIEYRKAAI